MRAAFVSPSGIRCWSKWVRSLLAAGSLAGALTFGSELSSPLDAADRPARPGKVVAPPKAGNTEKPVKPAAELARNPLEDLKHWVERNFNAREVSDRQRDHESIRQAFREVVQPVRASLVRVLADDMAVAFGTVVSDNGLVVTKASELRGSLKCVLSDRRTVTAKIVSTSADCDLALLRLETTDKLTPVDWALETPGVGSFLATPGQGELPTAIGVMSVVARRIAPAIGFLGVGLDQERPRVILIQPGSSADKAGLQIDDYVVGVNGNKIENRENLQQQIRKHVPGEKVELLVRRGDHEFKVTAVLGDANGGAQAERADFQNRLGGGLSVRRAGFESVLQHDTVLYPNECGGPVIDLDGKAVGINIARAGRVATYAIPANVARRVVEKLIVDQQREGNVAERTGQQDTSNKAGG